MVPDVVPLISWDQFPHELADEAVSFFHESFIGNYLDFLNNYYKLLNLQEVEVELFRDDTQEVPVDFQALRAFHFSGLAYAVLEMICEFAG